MRAFWFIIFAAIALFLGCAKPAPPLASRSVVATIKTPTFSVSQSGFIDAFPNDEYRLQIYAAGHGALELRVGEKICKGAFCMSAAEFNRRYLSANYPPNFLRDILGRRTIAGLKNSVVASGAGGWIQTATLEGKYDVRYENSGDFQRVRDSVNRVLIVIVGAN
ncbi:MAG: hypothetical protein LBO72_01715 [Helicobacteraceae bacterium]|jgi:hypothetical protein|nr:hypothetical protein [Helicobacteraceae bacterium]